MDFSSAFHLFWLLFAFQLCFNGNSVFYLGEYIYSLYSIFQSNLSSMSIPKIFLIVALLFTLSKTQAQFRAGVTGGVVLSSLIRDGQINAKAGRAGYLVGVNAKYNLGELGWFIGSGVNYSLEGDSDQSLNWIKVPLVLGLDVSDEVNINVVYDLAWQVGNDNGVQDFYKSMANMIGLGSEIYIGENFALGLRLNYGLSNLVEVPADAKNLEIKPLTFDLYLTYFLF